jgi:hypothetical protein
MGSLELWIPKRLFSIRLALHTAMDSTPVALGMVFRFGFLEIDSLGSEDSDSNGKW